MTRDSGDTQTMHGARNEVPAVSMLDRRRALQWIGGGTLAGLTGCGGGGDTSSSGSASTSVSSASCAETLEGEEGPYFVDDSASGYLRSAIVANLDGSDVQAGVALTLTVNVFDSTQGCTALQGAQVDIWHCNAHGVYSAESVESTLGQSWLRGDQLTDAAGKVTFTTIVPGWYAGRTTHIHLRIRSAHDETDTSGSNTVQLFFDQTLIDTLSTSVAPYSSEGTNPTSNASDRVYTQQEKGTTLLALTGDTASGYAASFDVYVPISS